MWVVSLKSEVSWEGERGGAGGAGRVNGKHLCAFGIG